MIGAVLAVWQWVAGSRVGRWAAIAAGAMLFIGLVFLRGKAAARAEIEVRRLRQKAKRERKADDAVAKTEKELRDATRGQLVDRVRDAGL